MRYRSSMLYEFGAGLILQFPKGQSIFGKQFVVLQESKHRDTI